MIRVGQSPGDRHHKPQNREANGPAQAQKIAGRRHHGQANKSRNDPSFHSVVSGEGAQRTAHQQTDLGNEDRRDRKAIVKTNTDPRYKSQETQDPAAPGSVSNNFLLVVSSFGHLTMIQVEASEGNRGFARYFMLF